MKDRGAKIRAAARAFAEAHGHRYGRGSSTDTGCECDRCGAAMVWSDAAEFVERGDVAYLGSLAWRCPGAP